MNFNCPRCGPLPHVYVNGCHLADRLLEGVLFKVEVSDERVYTVTVLPEYQEFFSNFNEARFLEKARRHAETYDFTTCPTKGCSEDICLQPWLEEEGAE